VAVFVFSAVFLISILESDIGLFRWLEMYPEFHLFAGLIHDELFGPTTMQSDESGSTTSLDGSSARGRRGARIITDHGLFRA
jgi:hypothetical protein